MPKASNLGGNEKPAPVEAGAGCINSGEGKLLQNSPPTMMAGMVFTGPLPLDSYAKVTPGSI